MSLDGCDNPQGLRVNLTQFSQVQAQPGEASDSRIIKPPDTAAQSIFQRQDESYQKRLVGLSARTATPL